MPFIPIKRDAGSATDHLYAIDLVRVKALEFRDVILPSVYKDQWFVFADSSRSIMNMNAQRSRGQPPDVSLLARSNLRLGWWPQCRAA